MINGSMIVPMSRCLLRIFIKLSFLSSVLISDIHAMTTSTTPPSTTPPVSSPPNTTTFRTSSASFLTTTPSSSTAAATTAPGADVKDTSTVSIFFTYAMPVNLLTWNETDSAVYAAGVAEVAGVAKPFVHPQYPARRAVAAPRIRTRVGVPPGTAYYDIMRRITFESLNTVLVRLGFPAG